MTRRQTITLICVVAAAAYLAGAGTVRIYTKTQARLARAGPAPLEEYARTWPAAFRIVEIPSSSDGTRQKAYYYRTKSSAAKPLVVSLHGWSGDFSKRDSLSEYAQEHDWNFIHPDFRGPNRTPESCLGPRVIPDIDDAISYAITQGGVDTARIFVVGASGGGLAAAGSYARSRHSLRAVLAWVPITDLRAWYWQSLGRDTSFAQDILRCTGSGRTLDTAEATRRSPLYWELPSSPRTRIELYAGVDDGYSGPIPVSQSVLFYNRIVTGYGDAGRAVTADELVELLSRGMPPLEPPEMISNRRVIFRRGTSYASITVFEGGHEMLAAYCFERMRALAGQDAATNRSATGVSESE